MAGYEEYLGRLKREEGRLDADRMHKGIRSRMIKRSRSRLIGGSLLLVFVFASLVYFFGGPYQNSGGELIAGYVFEPESPNGDAILNYVLMD